MKKLLFTLCAVLVGLSASALEAKYVNNSGEAVGNEVTIEPGKTLQLHVNVTGLDAIVFGFQEQWVMRDVEGNAYATDGNVNLKKTAGKYFAAEGMSTFLENALGNSNPTVEGEVIYRIIATNSVYGIFWSPTAAMAADHIGETENALYDEYGCTEAMFTQGNVFKFTIQTSADWNEEYATLDFDQDFDKLSLKPAPNSAKLALPDLKIKNANWQEPLEDLTGTVTFTVDEETGKVSVNYSGTEDVNIKVMYNGEEVDMPYQLTSGAEPIKLTYEVTAEGYNPLTGESQDLSWTEPVPDQTEAPVITYTAENGTLTVTATGAEGDAIILNGPNVEPVQGTTTATATVTYDPYVGYTGTWTATAQADGELVSVEAEEAITVAATTPTVATPEIEFVETKANGEVTKVEVVVTNYTSYDVYVDGELLRGEVIEASTEAAKQIHVQAVNDPIANHSEFAKEAEKDYTLNKLRKDVAAPVITTATDADAVTVTITWPESDGEHMYNGQYSYPRTDEDYSVNVEAYTAQSANYNESAHATLTIDVPKKEVAPVEPTGAPVFVNSPYTKPNVNADFVQLDNSEPGATIYYQITYPDGTTSGWLEYTPGQEIACYGANGGGQDGTYNVEAYAQAPGKDPSSHINLAFNVDETTGIAELINGKAIANVRYFNMAGQEMQEANGMTIVVTTYTDGTTSAVKVMK